MKKIFFLFAALLAVSLLSGPAEPVAHAAATPTVAKSVPTSIKSSRMTYNADGQTVVFTGNVHVSRPDFELWAEKLTVFLKKDKNGGSKEEGGLGGMQAGELDRIVAEGNVRIKTHDGKTGNSAKLTYFSSSNTLLMEGSPILRDKTNYIKGDRIIHHIQTGQSDVEGNVTGEFQSTDVTPIREEAGAP